MVIGSKQGIEEGILVDAFINAFHCPRRFIAPHIEDAKILLDLKGYMEDPKNKSVVPESIQKEIYFPLAKNKYCGRIDQVRFVDGKYRIYDIKYSKLDSKHIAVYYLPALIVYAYALNVEVGGIVNVRNYNSARPVFIEFQGVDVKRLMHNINDTLIYKLYKEGSIKCT